MKRLLLIVLVLAILVGAALWFFCGRGTAGNAGLVPADSAFYLSLPDMKRSGERWPKTALAQIGADPAVADFLAQPLALLNEGGATEAREILDKIDPKSLFFAVTGVSRSGAHVLLGVEYSGARKDLDDALARFYSELSKKASAAQSTADYKGDVVTTVTVGKPVLFTAVHDKWVFLSNNEAVLQQALDRAAGRGGAPALAGDGDYKKVLGHLAASPDLLWYANPKTVIDLLAEISKEQEGEVSAQQFDQMRKMIALGGTLTFDGEKQKETAFILYPEAPKLGALTRSPMTFTTPGTSIYFDSAMDTQTVSTDAYIQSLPPEGREFLTNAKIDLKQLPQILGNDAGFVFDWPAGAFIPNALMAIEIKDRAAVQNMLQATLTAFALDASPTDSNGAAVYHFKGTQFIEPSIAVTDKFLLGSLTASEMSRALSVQPGAPTLETAAEFKTAASTYAKAGAAFGFIDTKALFDRIYNMLSPMMAIAGAMSPEVGRIVDVKKIPPTEAISSHLSPIIYSSDQTSDGIFIESSGPITLSQAFGIIVLGGAGAFAAQMMQ
jgi:hypothetical protein